MTNRKNDSRLEKHPLGFWEIKNKPTQEELTDYYKNKYFQFEKGNYRSTYSNLELENIKFRNLIKFHIVNKYRNTNSAGSMLDVGCGEGFSMSLYLDHGWQVCGLDYSNAGILSANQKLIQFLLCGDLMNLIDSKIESSETYDTIWLVNVLEHVLDPLKLLTQLLKLLNSDGVLVVTVPNDCSKYQHKLLKAGHVTRRYWVSPPDHLSYFNTKNLDKVFNATGWETKEIHGDFPIDIYLSNEHSNYVNTPEKGKKAHQARLEIEDLIFESGIDNTIEFFRSLANVGLGRDLTAFLTPK